MMRYGMRKRVRFARRSCENALRASGAFVELESVEWLPEACNQDTPESLLIERQDREHAEPRGARTVDLLSRIPVQEALALTFAFGLFGQRAHSMSEVGLYLDTTEEAAAALVESARQRVEQLWSAIATSEVAA